MKSLIILLCVFGCNICAPKDADELKKILNEYSKDFNIVLKQARELAAKGELPGDDKALVKFMRFSDEDLATDFCAYTVENELSDAVKTASLKLIDALEKVTKLETAYINDDFEGSVAELFRQKKEIIVEYIKEVRSIAEEQGDNKKFKVLVDALEGFLDVNNQLIDVLEKAKTG